MASNSRRDDDKDDGRAENIELADSSATLAERLAKERDDMRMGWTPWFKEKMRRGDGETNGLENVTSNEELLRGEDGENAGGEAGGEVVWRVYKRRWFGLVQLVLLNVVVSWDWLTFAPVAQTASEYYGVSLTYINWLATSFLFSFVVATPVALNFLHNSGPKKAILTASYLLLLGNWIKYCSTAERPRPQLAMFGQIICGWAQPFVLTAPTRYSDLWFTSNGRVAATAVMSLANPLGGALGQLINPFWAENKDDVPWMLLWIAIIATVAGIPSLFLPARPPTPPAPSATEEKLPIMVSLKRVLKSPEFLLILIPFWVFVGLFNSLSSLLNQILYPYDFTEEEAGIAGAILIVVGLVAAAISSPIIDRSKAFLLAIKIQTPIVAICYLAFIFAPPTRNLGYVYAILALLGAASFSLVPVVLEFVAEITHPISPEISSVICWTGGQLLGGLFIVISDALTDGPNGGSGDDVPRNMQRALWFHAVLALLAAIAPMCLGLFGRKEHVRLKRVEADRAYNHSSR